MFHELHATLRRLLYEYGRIDDQEVDVEFEAPTPTWVNSRTRPTIDLFLYYLQENVERRHSGMQTTRENGMAMRRMAMRRFDLGYMVSVLTTEARDEHLLLARATVTLLKYAQIPEALLSEPLRGLDLPVTARLGQQGDGPDILSVWSGLGVPPRPALAYVVTMPVDLDTEIEAPLVLSRTVRYANVAAGGTAAAVLAHIGGVVRDRSGVPVKGVVVTVEGSAARGASTDDEGRFSLTGLPEGPFALLASREGRAPVRKQVIVPADAYNGYDIILD